MTEAAQLIQHLASDELRCRTGILMLPDHWLGREGDIAARLNVQHEDFTTHLLAAAPKTSQYLNLNVGKVFELIDDIADSRSGMTSVLISQVDVAATRLTSADRSELWRRLLEDFPYRRKAVLFAISAHMQGVGVLQERSIYDMWLEANRIGTWDVE